MDTPKIDLSRTELDFLKRMLLDLQHQLGCTRQASDSELEAAIEQACQPGLEPASTAARVKYSMTFTFFR